MANERVVEAFLLYSVAQVGYVVRNGVGKITDSVYKHIAIQPEIDCESLPLSRTDVARPILATNLHGETNSLQIEIVRQNACNVVQGRKSRATFGADQQGIVLPMRVCSSD